MALVGHVRQSKFTLVRAVDDHTQILFGVFVCALPVAVVDIPLSFNLPDVLRVLSVDFPLLVLARGSLVCSPKGYANVTLSEWEIFPASKVLCLLACAPHVIEILISTDIGVFWKMPFREA
jgi:hypothetical protein